MLLHSVPPTLQQAAADPCLLRRLLDNRGQVWVSLLHGVADPAIWDASRGESIADTAMRHGVYFTPGDHQRLPGWMQCHYRLQFDENGYARCYIFENCRAFLRTVPLMMYDPTRPEDLDSSLEDHIADEWRYFCMSRPVKPLRPVQTVTLMNDPLGRK